jgi:SAM-dependent methyltransferase
MKNNAKMSKKPSLSDDNISTSDRGSTSSDAESSGGSKSKGAKTKAAQGKASSFPKKVGSLACAVAVIAVVLKFVILPKLDPMKGLSPDVVIGPWTVQAVLTAFCLTPGVLDQFLEAGKKGDSHVDPSKEGVEIDDFLTTGEIREDEYDKGSIYAILYALYRNVGPVKHTDGSLYEFSFNTWGIHSPGDKPYGPEEPQRHGKAAYHQLAASFPKVQEMMASRPKNSVTFLEIGCGTGAGGNLISSKVWPNMKVYNAVDMQAAGIHKCKSWGNPKLNCVHHQAGVGKALPFDDDSVDVVIINETHIAEIEIGPEEFGIFKEMLRVLKKGGFFLWGNAIPTKVWNDAFDVLPQIGFQNVQRFNHTESAVIARDQDHARVDLYMEQLHERYPVFSIPHYGPRCQGVTEALIRNFFRDVGTDLYNRMVTKEDSYMHACFQLNEKPDFAKYDEKANKLLETLRARAKVLGKPSELFKK